MSLYAFLEPVHQHARLAGIQMHLPVTNNQFFSIYHIAYDYNAGTE
jgi:hypothetical protein